MSIEHHLEVNESGHLFITYTDENRGSSESVRDEDQLILLYIYPEGDCDYCNWPFESATDKERLADTLYDEGNMDRIQPGLVFLPDGKLFGEIVPCGFKVFEEIFPPTVWRYKGIESDEAEEVPCSCYENAMKHYTIGDPVRIHASAPGCGYREYRIMHMSKHGVYGVLVDDTVEILTPEDVI